MKSYEPSTPRTAFAVAAAALTAISLYVLIVVPTLTGSTDAVTQATAKASESTTVVDITPSRIDVIGTREKNVAAVPAPADAPKQKPEG